MVASYTERVFLFQDNISHQHYHYIHVYGHGIAGVTLVQDEQDAPFEQDAPSRHVSCPKKLFGGTANRIG